MNRSCCSEVHAYFNSLPRYNFSFDDASIPKNGIYILFESGEYAHGSLDRIVRIGTHTGKNQLRSRLKQHFTCENKDRSIFRKNIGRAILNRECDNYLDAWEIDFTTRANKERFKAMIDTDKQQQIESLITKILHNTFSFCILEVDDKNTRLDLESKIISTVSSCSECRPSNAWLGSYSTKKKIVESGLWLVNELYKAPLNENDMKQIKKSIAFT